MSNITELQHGIRLLEITDLTVIDNETKKLKPELFDIATKDKIGLIKIGENVTVEPDGTINIVATGDMPLATETTIGGLLSDDEDNNEFIKVETNGKVTIKDNGHRHITENITDLNEKLDEKSDLIHSHEVATNEKDGFMSIENKQKLDNIEDGANKYVLPIATNEKIGGFKPGKNLYVNNKGILCAGLVLPFTLNITLIKNDPLSISNIEITHIDSQIKTIIEDVEQSCTTNLYFLGDYKIDVTTDSIVKTFTQKFESINVYDITLDIRN